MEFTKQLPDTTDFGELIDNNGSSLNLGVDQSSEFCRQEQIS